MQILLHLMQLKYIKMHLQEILKIGCNMLEFFCVPLNTHYLSDLHKKFEAASTCDTNVDHENLQFLL